MSIINDALKKAQRERGDGQPPAAPVAQPGPTPEPTEVTGTPGKPSGTPLLLAAGGGAAVVLVVVLGFLFLRSPSKPESAKAEAPKTVAQAPAKNSDTVAPKAEAASSVAVTAPAPVTVTTAKEEPAKPGPAPAEPVVKTEPDKAAPAFTLPLSAPVTKPAEPAVVAAPAPETAPASEPPAAATAEPAAVKPTAHLNSLVESFRVSGIRAAGPDSKVLMNDRVYRLNDVVDIPTGLRLVGVTEHLLTFADPSGATYTHRF